MRERTRCCLANSSRVKFLDIWLICFLQKNKWWRTSKALLRSKQMRRLVWLLLTSLRSTYTSENTFMRSFSPSTDLWESWNVLDKAGTLSQICSLLLPVPNYRESRRIRWSSDRETQQRTSTSSSKANAQFYVNLDSSSPHSWNNWLVSNMIRSHST